MKRDIKYVKSRLKMPSERRQTFFKGQMVYQKNIMVLKLFPTRAVQVKEVIFFFIYFI